MKSEREREEEEEKGSLQTTGCRREGGATVVVQSFEAGEGMAHEAVRRRAAPVDPSR